MAYTKNTRKALSTILDARTGSGGGQAGLNVQLGQIILKDGNQKFVPFTFNGTTPSLGTSETFQNLYTYNTVNPVPGGGGSTSFYKCASVSTGEGILVSGAGTANANGVYTLTSGSGYSRVWTNANGYTISYEDSSMMSWNIYGDGSYKYRGQDTQDPWQATSWHNMDGWWDGQEPFPTVALQPGTPTWTGYKAVQDSTTKIWSFEQSLTTDTLTFDSSKRIPVPGYTYTSDCLVQCSLYEGWAAPSLGLVFHAPLSEYSETAQTGQVYSGSMSSYNTIQGIPCACFNSNVLSASDIGFNTGSLPSTMTGWMYMSELPNPGWYEFFTYGSHADANIRIGFGISSSGVIRSGSFVVDCVDTDLVVANKWYFIASVYDGERFTLYVDGTLKSYLYSSMYTTLSNVSIGSVASGSGSGYLAGLRIYNRALSSQEIATLASEFTPTNA